LANGREEKTALNDNENYWTKKINQLQRNSFINFLIIYDIQYLTKYLDLQKGFYLGLQPGTPFACMLDAQL